MPYGDGSYGGRAYAGPAAAAVTGPPSGEIAGTLSGPTATLTGTVKPPGITGTLPAAIKGPTAALTGGPWRPGAVAPTADFFVNSVIGQTAYFSGSGSQTSDGANPPRFKWDFGDGTVVSGTNGPPDFLTSPSHTYAAGGTYQVTLIVSDPSNIPAIDSAPVTHSVTVTSPFTGTVSGTVAGPTATLAGTYAPPPGRLTGTVTGPTATLTGAYAPPPAVGTLTGALPSTTGTLAGTSVAPAAAITGTLTGALPPLAGALAADVDTGASPLTRSDLSDYGAGRTRNGEGEDRTLYPVAAVPPHLRVEPMRIVAHQLPTPTLTNGRPT
jgi:PKD repeat protein